MPAIHRANYLLRFIWLYSIVQDLRFAIRGFRRSPGFVFTVIGTLGLGLGILATSFSIFSAFVLRPFAVHDPYSLYQFYWLAKGNGARDFNYVHMPGTWREFQDVRQQKAIFTDAFAYRHTSSLVGGRTATVEIVSGNYFNMLGARACLGRPLVESDGGPGDHAVGVVSDAAWKRAFNSDPNVVGKKLYFRNQPVEIVGVACPPFNGLEVQSVDYWVPLALSGALTKGAEIFGDKPAMVLTVIGRLKPGMTEDGARAALLTYGRQIGSTWLNGKPPEKVQLYQRATPAPLGREAVKGFMPIFVAFGLILLIACANVSNMMLARSLGRQREIGIRISLGAGRLRMVRLLLTESLLLAIPSAFAAFAVAYGTIAGALRLIYATLPPNIAANVHLIDLTPDSRVMAFLLAAAGIATIFFGLAPAIQATRSSLVQANRGEFANDYRPSKLRNSLVVVQVMVCSLLLISAAISLRSERSAASIDPGLDLHGVFTARVPEKFRAAALDRLGSLPSAIVTGTAWNPPVSLNSRSISLDGRAPHVNAGFCLASPEYFAMLGVSLVRGRNFSVEEGNTEAAVAIVSDSAARRLWPKEEAVGQTVNIPGGMTMPGQDRVPGFRTAMVVGIAHDAIYDRDSQQPDGSSGPNAAFIYFPTGPKAKHAEALMIRMRGDRTAARRILEAELDKVAPASVEDIGNAEEMLDLQLYPYRVLFALTGFLGGLALLLTISGVYGVLSYVVNQRRREFGIRVALGAQGRDVVGMVFRQSLRLASIGAALGAVLALGVAKLIAHSIRPIHVFDAAGYAAGALLVIASALAATWVPAKRALKIEPSAALRCD